MMQEEGEDAFLSPSLSAQFGVVGLYFSFAAPSVQLYTDSFPLVFLKFLSSLPNQPDP